jgi:hypothetical protein
VLTPEQIAIVYLMFLNGILFLSLHFIGFSIVNPGDEGSKRIGYTLLLVVLLIAVIQQQYEVMIQLSFNDGDIRKILLGGFVTPVFLLSIVYYRIRQSKFKNK